MTDSAVRGIRCVGAIVHDDRGRLLLVRRANDPGRGLWSIPGGRVEPGETDPAAVAREVLEETAITVDVGAHVGTVHRPAPSGPGSAGAIFEIHDYACSPLGGTVRAGDDADEARWCDRAGVETLPLVPGLLDVLREWGCLPVDLPEQT